MWMLLSLVSVLGQLTSTQPAAVSDVPGILLKAFEYRTDFKTASLEYRKTSTRRGRNPAPLTRVENNEVRWAADNAHIIQNGDDDGINYRLAGSMEPALGIRNACLPSERLLEADRGVLWDHQGSYPLFGRSRPTDWLDYVDIRSVGLAASEFQRATPLQILKVLQGDHGLRFRILAADSSLKTVIGTTKVNPSTGERLEIAWDLDTAKGPSVLASRTTVINREGKREVIEECRNHIGQIDGRWWPISTDYEADGLEIHYKFSRIEFNRPEHPKRLDTEYFGIPIGARIQDTSPEGLKARKTLIFGDQGAILEMDAWEKIKMNYDLTPHRNFVTRMQALGPGYTPKWWDQSLVSSINVKDPDEWTVYVRRWIYRHTNNGNWQVSEPLSDQQRAAAEGILKDCKSKAMPIQLRINREIARIDAELSRLVEMKSTTAPADNLEAKGRVKQFRSQRAELERSAELVSLFDELKKRLDDLLTAEQKSPTNAKLQVPVPVSERASPGRRGPSIKRPQP